MSNTWNDSPIGAVFSDPVNSELYFAENRRNRWTEHGEIKRGPHISQYRFKPPRAGIHQSWDGEQRRGATMGQEGGTFKLFRGLVQSGVKARKEKQKQDQQATANWQGAYQQASQRSQSPPPRL